KHILFSPHPGGDLSHASVEFLSMHGAIKSAWQIENNKFIYSIEVPANTTAKVTLPAAELNNLKVNSAPISEELKSKSKQIGNEVILKVGSGKYQFSYPFE
ncbi:MAG: hypothetical protein HOG79_00245, partial [Prolixibacteraceae bacterium]|nr:hypothetical protein [Prolixibacteraceae bacterium]